MASLNQKLLSRESQNLLAKIKLALPEDQMLAVEVQDLLDEAYDIGHDQGYAEGESDASS